MSFGQAKILTNQMNQKRIILNSVKLIDMQTFGEQYLVFVIFA